MLKLNQLERKKVLSYQSSAKLSRTEQHQCWLTGVKTKNLPIPIRHTHTHTYTGALSCCSQKEMRFLDKPSPGRVKKIFLNLQRIPVTTEHRIP